MDPAQKFGLHAVLLNVCGKSRKRDSNVILDSYSWGMAPFAYTRHHALAQIEEFQMHAADYGHRRNYVLSGGGNVTRLSPAVRARLVTERELVHAWLARHPFAAVEKLIQECCWRIYWKGWLELRPNVWARWRQWQNTDPEMTVRIRALEEGRSGVAVMDAWARELVETGYLHNHARMWFASFWVHVCRLPWQAGAAFFYRHLLDGDAASNTLSWRWVAGLQTRGKAYLVRRTNMEKYAGEHVTTFPEGLERLNDDRVEAMEMDEDFALLEPGELPLLAGAWPSSEAWLVHGEDLSVEMVNCEAAPRVILLVPSRWNDAASDYFSKPVLQFESAALEDAERRLRAKFPEATVELVSPDGETLACALRKNAVKQVAIVQPHVGWIGDAWPNWKQAISELGIEVMEWRRAADSAWFPHAKKGYFPFWQALRERLKREGAAAIPD